MTHRLLLKLVSLIHSLIKYMVCRYAALIRARPIERANLMRFISGILQKVLNILDFDHDIIVNRHGFFTRSDGIELSALHTNRQLKVIGSEVHANFGTTLAEFLLRHGISQPEIIVDVGANFGEVSLGLAKSFPSCKIFAIEPVSHTFQVLEVNLATNPELSGSISPVKLAITDFTGSVEITNSFGAQNSLVLGPQNPKFLKKGLKKITTELVPCTTLQSFFELQDIKMCDLLKIDIEGAEHLLTHSLRALLPKIKVIVLEVGDKAPFSSYVEIIDHLIGQGWSCCPARDWNSRILAAKDVADEVADYFFVRP